MELIINSLKYGKCAVLIDDEDAEKVLKHTWHIIVNSYDKTQLHAVVTNAKIDGKKKTLYLHSLITGFCLCDHVDGNVLNNQKENLRRATKAQNCQNQRKHSKNTSGYKGVHWNAHAKKWQALIMANYMREHLGYFKTKEQAALAYNEAALKYHGKFARLNEVIV